LRTIFRWKGSRPRDTGRRCREVRIPFSFLAAAILFVPVVQSAQLKTETLEAWKLYEKLTEKRIASELASKERFLAQDFLPVKERDRCRSEILQGEPCIVQMRTLTPEGKKIEVPDGLVHHWMGAIRVPDAKLGDLLKWIEDYDRHADYFEEVTRSRLLSRNGNDFKIFYRLRRTKFITVHYNTEHEVIYHVLDAGRAESASRATRIAELVDAETPEEREKPVGNDSGFMWRLNSYWRFQQVGNDVLMSCESISLSRSIPRFVSMAFGWIVDSVPRESLENTLQGIRDGFKKTAAGR
jgi:hypothetical protein